MHDDRPSQTAAWVAVLRGLGRHLPLDLRLIDDPFGLRFASNLPVGRLLGRALDATAPFWVRGGRVGRGAVGMQLRSRAIDDAVRELVKGGAEQVVLLGAGFDCRAWRLLPDDREVTFFEVDHPATQRAKREHMRGERGSRVRFLPWNFEKDPLDALPDRLADLGFDRAKKTMTLVEGVLIYLTEAAVSATFACVAALSAPGSRIAFTYCAAELLGDQAPEVRRERRLVGLIGEPFRFGFAKGALEPWLASRGFRLVQDESFDALARRFFGASRAARLPASPLWRLRYVAVAERMG